MKKKNGLSINWYLLSEYRKELFGLSIISIIVFHFFEDIQNNVDSGIIAKTASLYNSSFGSIGVEIFLFLSGIGLYFSLNKDDSVLQFYRKRIKRVVIPYMLYGAIFWFVKDIIILHTSFYSFVMDYTLLSFWINGNKNLWYIALIIILYLICPILYKLLNGNNRFRIINVILLVLLPICFLGIIDLFSHNIYDNIEIAVYRIPVFALGLYFGDKIMKKKALDKADIILMAFCVVLRGARVVGGIGDYIPPRVSVGFFSLPVVFVLAYLIKLCHLKKLNSFLSLAGMYSLELYMTHVTVRTIMNLSGLPTYKIYNYIICIAISVVLSVILNKVTNAIVSKKKKPDRLEV